MTDEEWWAKIAAEKKAKADADAKNTATTADNESKGIYTFSGNQADAYKAMKYGEGQGERITGGTMEQAGQGRAQVRSRLEDIFSGNSAGANRLSQSQNADAKQLKAGQAMQGGGSQMAAGQQQMQQRQAGRDLAGFKADEQRRALGDMSREFRGMGGDIMKASGQYGSIMMGAKPPEKAEKTPYSEESWWDKQTRDWT